MSILDVVCGPGWDLPCRPGGDHACVHWGCGAVSAAVCVFAEADSTRAESPPLPGTIPLASMQRITNSIGRCSVCNLASAVYHDRETGVRLCEACYSREAVQQTLKKRVGDNPHE
jgi:hypothetical protein